ncbi:IclR family transcriptional regulator [Bacillus sp. 1P06AnD]|uniref:IclR family transcriptional regulator n=1 Tax=Bacillus sp. 1P06AnD TaxID=3132208 RepID=UPI0039A061CD
MQTAKSSNVIQSLQVGMSVIDAISTAGKPLRFSDIQESTSITKSNLYKYLNTLTQLDMLYRDPMSGMYSLGARLIQYGMSAIDQEDASSRVAPYLVDICQEADNTVLFTTWTYKGPIVVKIQSPPHNLNIGAQIGTILPPFSSSGKVYNSFLEEEVKKEWLRENGFPAEGQGELQKVRESCISFAREPLVPSVSSVSVPILNFNSELVGSLTVVGFKESIPDSPDHPLSIYLRQKSFEISQTFGYRQP